MNFEPVEKIANAVLYEGFLLYPYRRSSVKISSAGISEHSDRPAATTRRKCKRNVWWKRKSERRLR